MDIEQAMQEYQRYLLREGYSKNTIKIYTGAIQSNFVEKNLDNLTQEDLNEIKLRLRGKYSDGGNKARISGINLFCKIILKRPELHLTLPHPKNKNKDVLTSEQVEKILAAARDAGRCIYAMLLTMYDCALRKGEIINLSLEDIHFDANEIYIRDAKTGDGIVTISDRAVQAIKDYFERERKPAIKEGKALFLTQYGLRIGKKFIRYHVKNCAVNAGITKRVYPHIFRASCITHLLNKGINPLTVQIHARHNNFATTMLYNRPTQQQMHKDIKKVFDKTPKQLNDRKIKKEEKQPDRLNKLVDKLIEGEISEDTFNNILSTFKRKLKYKDSYGMYI